MENILRDCRLFTGLIMEYHEVPIEVQNII